jgi:hypothetical protein
MNKVKLMITVAVLYLCNNLNAQDWFNSIYDNLSTIPSVFDVDTQANSLTEVEITINQYSDLIGNFIPYVYYTDEKVANVIYGTIDSEFIFEGLSMPTVSILGKLNLNENYKIILIKIKETPVLGELPDLILCSLNNSNLIISNILLGGSGPGETYGGEVLSDHILQKIAFESSAEFKKFILNSDGYFKLTSKEKY